LQANPAGQRTKIGMLSPDLEGPTSNAQLTTKNGPVNLNLPHTRSIQPIHPVRRKMKSMAISQFKTHAIKVEVVMAHWQNRKPPQKGQRHPLD
jgi:hypothetical protein